MPVGIELITVTRKIRFDEVLLETTADSLVLRGLECWIHEEDITMELTNGRAVMNKLGYSTANLLTAARERNEEYRLDDHDERKDVNTPFARMHRVWNEGVHENGAADRVDEMVTLPELTDDSVNAMRGILQHKIDEALDSGLPPTEGDTLWALLSRYEYVLRLSFGNDPPVDVPVLRVRLKEGVRPVKAKARRYPPSHKQYLDQQIQELLDDDLVGTSLLS